MFLTKAPNNFLFKSSVKLIKSYYLLIRSIKINLETESNS